MILRKDESGQIAIETLGSFTLFLLLVISILSLVNIVALQARIHNALTQSVNTLSVYSYALAVTGVAGDLMNLDSHADEARDLAADVKDVFEKVENLKPAEADLAELQEDVTNLAGEAENFDPKSILNLVLDEAGQAAFDHLARVLVGVYLANGEPSVSGDAYLRNVHVVDGLDGLHFNQLDLESIIEDGGSKLLDSEGNVTLVVEYDIEYRFGNLPLPFDPKLHVVQTVKTKAWLNGSGEGYHE